MSKVKNIFHIIIYVLIFYIIRISTIIEAAVITSPIKNDAKWSIKESPYFIENTLIIEKGATLIIEPDVKVIFKKISSENKINLIVYGAINAVGQKNNNIVFTSDYPVSGAWGGIIFENNDNQVKSEVSYCRIEYAACGIGCFKSSPVIKNNIFSFNEVAIVCENRASPIIDNNFLTENGVFRSIPGGISCALYSDPKITNNIIEKNKGYGICASTYSRPIISNNIIRQVWGRGIVVFSNALPLIMNNEIYSNRSYGIVSFQSSPVITGNNIYKNMNSGIIALLGSSPSINNNLIHENGTGINSIYP
ncbi:right-handed parallel beta-helix repeat-containing protein, partial [Candidatus Desantisbacteria bacterium]|nr:right-handed parallel beta-helix repeat-containing protein [Candidatus Desantisbacteria bacterium]